LNLNAKHSQLKIKGFELETKNIETGNEKFSIEKIIRKSFGEVSDKRRETRAKTMRNSNEAFSRHF